MMSFKLLCFAILPILAISFSNSAFTRTLMYHRNVNQRYTSDIINRKYNTMNTQTQFALYAKVEDKKEIDQNELKEPTAFEKVASTGLAGVLAIAAAESIFWALGMPLANLWVYATTGEWIDLMTKEGQLQAAGFTFGYGGFATVILQYRVTLFAIPLVPIMEKFVVEPGKKVFGEQFGKKE